MLLERLTVEEGFLAGLDVSFSPGLNVIIGPRGVGKTSIVELIRFVLGGGGYSEQTKAASLEHALGVLAGGRVSLRVQVQGRDFTFQRTATTATTAVERTERPIILAQREVELLGRSAKQRLRLLDSFVDQPESAPEVETQLSSSIASVFVHIRSTEAERARVRDQLGALVGARERLEAARTRQTQSSGQLAKLQPVIVQRDRLSDLAAKSVASENALKRARERISSLLGELKGIQKRTIQLDPWPTAAGLPDQLEASRLSFSSVMKHVTASVQEAEFALTAINERLTANSAEAARIDSEFRVVRGNLEAAQSGAGEAAREVSTLQQQVAQLEATEASLSDLEARLTALRREREGLLDELDASRERRFEARADAARSLETQVGPSIKIEVERFALLEDYASEIAGRLRGSALHSQRIASDVARAMSPRELVACIADQDIVRFSAISGIGEDRAARVLSYLRDHEYDDLVSVRVEDDVRLSLLDGKGYKSIDELSTGQRCTVVLPIVLVHPRRTVIVDQPEDHLDNAFIVDTLIRAITKRKAAGQMILTTHNANIPVLGEADLVVELGSDGRRGFVRNVGPLDNPAIVEAISSVMEGGREAFCTPGGLLQAPRQGDMTGAEAVEMLRAPLPHLRLAAARTLLRSASHHDYAAVSAARSVETVSWIRVALDAVLARLRQEMSGGLTTPAEVTSAEEKIRREVEGIVTQQVTSQLLHEIEPLVGLARLHARTEIQAYEPSNTRKTLDQLADLLGAVATLNLASRAPRSEDFDLADLVASACKSVQASGVVPRLAGPAPFLARGDRTLIGLAVINGARNAVESVVLSGRAPEPTSVVVNWNSTDRDYWVAIIDSGVGLQAGTADPFGLGVTTKPGHVGMGLAAVRRAMWSLGGFAELENQATVGCKLELRWPRVVT